MNTKTTLICPIRFARLIQGSKYSIFAEPSRGIKKSHDENVYKKMCEAWSEKVVGKNDEGLDITDPNQVIILMPEDLVVPLSKGDN